MINHTPFRTNPRRRGTVLIFVVGILVLLALVATAYLSTARVDRVTAKQNEFNTQIDLLLESMRQAAVAAITVDDNAQYDPLKTSRSDYALNASNLIDAWLASRVPTTFDLMEGFDPLDATAPNNGGNYAIWQAVSGPVIGSTFEAPDGTVSNATRRYALVPTSTTFNGKFMPAFSYDNNTGTAFFQTGAPILLAGDADGDGIADSLPFKLPVGKINGLEYFGYVRIIDNNSAINVNTATARTADFDGAGTGQQNYGFFTANIGLAELLKTYQEPLPAAATDMQRFGAEFDRLNNWRYNGAGRPDGVFQSGAAVAGTPLNDNGSAADFYWWSVGDALQHQLTRRIDNPGMIRAGSRARAFTPSDSVALASRFLLKDSVGSQSDVERELAESLFSHAYVRATPYAHDQAQVKNGGLGKVGWFEQNFEYSAETPTSNATFLPRRALLTASANISNMVVKDAIDPAIRAQVGMNDFAANGTPKVSITTGDYADLVRSYYQVLKRHGFTIANHPDPYYGMKFNAATHVSDGTQVDTARQFKSPIRSVPDGEGLPTTPGVAPAAAYTNALKMSADQVVLLRAAIAAVNLETMRHQNTPEGSAAPAYTNGISNPDVARWRDISVGFTDGSSGTARIYGLQRQPYVTEVFAHSDDITAQPYNGGTLVNTKGYIAIELYNPYDVAIDIANCRFATLHRLRRTGVTAGETYPQMQLIDTSTLTIDPLSLSSGVKSNLDLEPGPGNPNDGFESPTIIPPNGYLVLENYDADSPAAGPTAALYRPGAVTDGSSGFPNQGPATIGVPVGAPPRNVAYVPNLHQLFNREFVLMRPQNAQITTRRVLLTGLAGGEQPMPTLEYTNPIATPNIATDFVPMDSYDLSGLVLFSSLENSAVGPFAYVRHYQRDTSQWRFVYPGRYDAAQAAVLPIIGTPFSNQQGTQQSDRWVPDNSAVPATPGNPPNHDTTDPGVPYATPQAVSPLTKPTSFGANNPSTRQNNFFSIQLLNKNWPGVNPLMPGYFDGVTLNPDPRTGVMYPFGKFARLGDMVQVPFIGSYVIWKPTTVGGPPPVSSTGSNPLVVEVNPVTMDAAMAEDTDTTDDPQDPFIAANNDPRDSREQIGRFVPLRAMWAGGLSEDESPTGGQLYNDYDIGNQTLWRYQFARYLFDFFTLESPAQDFLPNVKHSVTVADNTHKYLTTGGYVNLTEPQAVSNSGITPANGTGEQTEPVAGLININTAPRKVLAMIPWTNSATDRLTFDVATRSILLTPNSINDNEEIALAIEYWRDGDPARGIAPNGPFQTPFDLYKCPAIRGLQAALLVADPDDAQGDISPAATGTDGVRYDFEEQLLVLDRVSNLITTRSDTFTVYILLQGWRNAGTAAAELVVERRAAMIVDRSRYTPTNGNVSAIRVPTN